MKSIKNITLALLLLIFSTAGIRQALFASAVSQPKLILSDLPESNAAEFFQLPLTLPTDLKIHSQNFIFSIQKTLTSLSPKSKATHTKSGRAPPYSQTLYTF